MSHFVTAQCDVIPADDAEEHNLYERSIEMLSIKTKIFSAVLFSCVFMFFESDSVFSEDITQAVEQDVNTEEINVMKEKSLNLTKEAIMDLGRARNFNREIRLRTEELKAMEEREKELTRLIIVVRKTINKKRTEFAGNTDLLNIVLREYGNRIKGMAIELKEIKKQKPILNAELEKIKLEKQISNIKNEDFDEEMNCLDDELDEIVRKKVEMLLNLLDSIDEECAGLSL